MRTIITFLLASFLAISTASAAITIDIYASSGPSTDSPNFDSFGDNAITGIENGGVATGTQGTPGYFDTLDGNTADARDFIKTPDFTSWRADADPSEDFSSEHGNSLFFGFDIVGDGDTQFTLDNTSFEFDSTDSNDWFDEGPTTFPGGFSDHLNGISWGGDGEPGGGDDERFETGNSDTSVDRIVGLANAKSLIPTSESGTDQDKIDTIVDSVNSESPFEIEAEYGVVDNFGGLYAGSDTVTVNSVPEPTVFALLLGLVSTLVVLRRRRQ